MTTAHRPTWAPAKVIRLVCRRCGGPPCAPALSQQRRALSRALRLPPRRSVDLATCNESDDLSAKALRPPPGSRCCCRRCLGPPCRPQPLLDALHWAACLPCRAMRSRAACASTRPAACSRSRTCRARQSSSSGARVCLPPSWLRACTHAAGRGCACCSAAAVPLRSALHHPWTQVAAHPLAARWR